MHASTLLVLLAYFSSGVLAAPALDEKTLLSNGQQAQLLNADFADLKVSDSCENNELACIDGQFATCTAGKWEVTPCPGDLQCAALPLLNKVGTTVTCATEDDALARLDASGVNGGLVGDNANPANGTCTEATTTATETVTVTATFIPGGTRTLSPSEAAAIVSSASASTTATESASSVSPTSTATVVVTVTASSAASTTTTAASSSASAATSSTSSSASAATSTATATTTTGSAAAPTASTNPVLTQNGVDAQAQNRRFAGLTLASPCNPNALGTNTACIDGQLATCNAGGTWTATACPTPGTKCAAVPKRDIAGFSVGCFTDADALARFTQVGVPGGLTGA